MHHHPPRPCALLLCLALASCTVLAQGVAEDGVSSPSSPSEWSVALPSSLRHLGSPASTWGQLPRSDPRDSLFADPLYPMRLETIPDDSPRPLRALRQGVPKRLYFAPRLGKRSPTAAQGLEERERRDEATFPEGPDDTDYSPYRWWWPMVRRSTFSPRPGKRADGQTELDLPNDYLEGDLYDISYQYDSEEEEQDEEEGNSPVLQEKRGSGFAFSPRLGKKGRAGFSFGPRPGKKSNLAFAPRPGKKTNFAFVPRPGKKANFAFAPRPGKKSNFAFAPRPGKKTNFAFAPRPGKKANFAFAPRPGKRNDPTDGATQRRESEEWWGGETDGATATTLPHF